MELLFQALVSGIVAAGGGEILFEGESVRGLPTHEIVRRGLVQVPEGRKVFPSLTVIENLELGSFLPEARKRRAESLEPVFHIFPHLAERRRQPAGTLSGGERQMLAIGRGLMACPRLLMLDEPSLGLSPKVVTTVFESIRLINAEGTTVLLVEQNIVQSLRISHRGYVIEDGLVVRTGSGEELLNDPVTRRCYLASSR